VVALSNVILTTPSRAFSEHLMEIAAKTKTFESIHNFVIERNKPMVVMKHY